MREFWSHLLSLGELLCMKFMLNETNIVWMVWPVCPSCCHTCCTVCVSAIGLIVKCQLTEGWLVAFSKRSPMANFSLWGCLPVSGFFTCNKQLSTISTHTHKSIGNTIFSHQMLSLCSCLFFHPSMLMWVNMRLGTKVLITFNFPRLISHV